MPPRGEDITAKATKTTNQIAQHFKNVGLRKAEFKRQKSVLIEKELQVHFKNKHDEERKEAASRKRNSPPVTQPHGSSSPRANSRPGSAGRAASPKASGSSSPAATLYKSMSSPSASGSGFAFGSRPGTPGAVFSRFGASVPESNHPAIHPGAISRPPSQALSSRPRTRASTATGASELKRTSSSLAGELRSLQPQARSNTSGLLQTTQSGIEALHTAAELDLSDLHAGDTTRMQRAHGSFRPESPGSQSLTVPRRFSTQRLSTVSDSQRMMVSFSGFHESEMDSLWGMEPSREEQLFMAAEEEAAALSEVAERDILKRHPDPPDMIERLGDLMALLGPRYRTLPREAVWEKAVVGSTTSLQRREQRLGSAAARAISGGFKHRGSVKVKQHKMPENAPDNDPDGRERAAWLQAKEREKEIKARGGVANASPAGARMQASSASTVTLAPSMHLTMTELK